MQIHSCSALLPESFQGCLQKVLLLIQIKMQMHCYSPISADLFQQYLENDPSDTTE